MNVFPIGYSAPDSGARIDNLMNRPEVLLIDTRLKPQSWNDQWKREALQEKYGERYRWAGKYLGNIGYQDGYIEIADIDTGIRGLVRYLHEGHDLILLCQCKEYDKCHVSHIVRYLREMPDVEVVRDVPKSLPATECVQDEQETASAGRDGASPIATIAPSDVACSAKCTKCGGPAVLRSPSGAVYCNRCGRCQRRVYGTMRGIAVLREECKKTVEDFVKHPRMGIWCCPCVLEYEEKLAKREKALVVS